MSVFCSVGLKSSLELGEVKEETLELPLRLVPRTAARPLKNLPEPPVGGRGRSSALVRPDRLYSECAKEFAVLRRELLLALGAILGAVEEEVIHSCPSSVMPEDPSDRWSPVHKEDGNEESPELLCPRTGNVGLSCKPSAGLRNDARLGECLCKKREAMGDSLGDSVGVVSRFCRVDTLLVDCRLESGLIVAALSRFVGRSTGTLIKLWLVWLGLT